MACTLIDGKAISQSIKDELAEKVSHMSEKPCLAVILVGDDPASQIYVNNKKKTCAYIGIRSLSYEMDSTTTEEGLLALIDQLNADAGVNGILVQLPLPAHISEERVLLRIHPDKDVDCFHPYNIGLVQIGKPAFKPCTPAGAIELLKRSGVTIEGANCVVIGRSINVGKPAASLLLQENGTVTICHSRTKGLAEICARADILIAALGKLGFVTPDMVKEGAAVVDIGIHRLPGNKVRGDVDAACAEKAAFLTPVPGGVGLMTIAMLMENCVRAYHLQNPGVKNI